METPSPDNLEPRIDPREASRAYLESQFTTIEHRLEDGEIDIKQAELLRTEEYDWALHNIGIPKFDE